MQCAANATNSRRYVVETVAKARSSKYPHTMYLTNINLCWAQGSLSPQNDECSMLTVQLIIYILTSHFNSPSAAPAINSSYFCKTTCNVLARLQEELICHFCMFSVGWGLFLVSQFVGSNTSCWLVTAYWPQVKSHSRYVSYCLSIVSTFFS